MFSSSKYSFVDLEKHWIAGLAKYQTMTSDSHIFILLYISFYSYKFSMTDKNVEISSRCGGKKVFVCWNGSKGKGRCICTFTWLIRGIFYRKFLNVQNPNNISFIRWKSWWALQERSELASSSQRPPQTLKTKHSETKQNDHYYVFYFRY